MNKNNIPMKMKAVVLTEPGKFEVQQIPVPVPADDEVLCKIMAVSICGSDPEIFRGDLAGSWPPAYPFVAGHEWAGIVVSAGKNVTEYRPGDRVAGEAHCGCGKCENCMKGRYTLCLNYGNKPAGHRHYGFIDNGAYAQYQVYKPKALTPLPDSLTFAEGSMNDTVGVALHGVELTGVTPGGTAVVIGPGPIGLAAMRLAKAMGVARVIVVGRGDRLTFAKNVGADEVVDFSKEDPVSAVRKLTNEVGADEIFECSGAPGTVVQAIKMARRGGKVSMIGVAKDSVIEQVPSKYIAYNEIMVVGSKANPNVSKRVLQLMASGQVPVKDLISHRFEIDNMANALDVFVGRKENVVKVVICPHGVEEANA